MQSKAYMHQIPLVIMPRFRSGSLRPVNRIKHVIDRQSALTAGSGENTVLVLSTDTPTLAVSNTCETGSKVNGLFLIVEATRVGTTSDILANVYMHIAKNPGGNLTMPAANAVGISDNKKYVFHQEMVMLQGTNAGNPRTLFKGVIAVPKLYRRNGPNDEIVLNVFVPGVAINYCVQAHYKEFR